MSWLNGKKTAIGAVLMIVTTVITSLTDAGIQAPWFAQVMNIVNMIGMILGGIGVAHKGAKGELTTKTQP